MAIETNDMAVFLTVVREGSFGRAASSMLVSQPAVSERIARLERAVGAELFTRGARGVTLTTAGERLFPYARRALGLLDEAAEAVQSLDDAPPLRIAVHVTFAHRAVPLVLDAIGDLRRRIKVRDAHSDEIIAMLLDGVADIGFVLAGARPRPLKFIALPADPVICVCAPSHVLARRASVPLGALADHRLALNQWGTGATSFLDQLKAAGAPEWRWTECSDAVTAMRLARHHSHVALVSASIATDELIAHNLVRLNLRPQPRWSIPLVLAHRERDQHEPAVAAVRTAARQLTHPSRRGRR
jgi:DNA-binding transcriptional LysR family regulator